MKTNSERLYVYDLEPKVSTFYEDVINGLGNSPRSIPAKYFYAERGSRLFDAICETPEYYPTRTAYINNKRPLIETRFNINESGERNFEGISYNIKLPLQKKYLLDSYNPKFRS